MNSSLLRMPLNHTDMKFAMEHFAEAQEMVYAELSNDSKVMVQKWIDSVVALTPAFTLRPDAIDGALKAMYYGEETVRDFIFDLGFLFFSTWGELYGAHRLSASLVEGLSLDGYDPDTSLIPEVTLASMSVASFRQLLQPLPWWKRWMTPKQDLHSWLANNKTLLVMYLVYLTNSNVPVAPPAA